MSISDTAIKVGLPIAILVVAGAITARLIASREKPDRKPPQEEAAVVNTEIVHRKEHRLDVRASGTVEAARTATIQPQVTGNIVDVHDNLEPGGLIQEGEVLVQIDRSDYKIALDQRNTALEQAKAQLAREQGQQQVAEQEWELFKKEAGKDLTESVDPSLALRKPQLASAKAQVDSAKAQVEQAKVNLSRTTLRAPFDGIVQEESVTVGDLASTQSRLASLVASDVFWARLTVPPDKIPHIDIPNVNAEEGSNVEIRYDVGESSVVRDGHVLRLVGGLERTGRLARILVAVEDPLGLETPTSEREEETAAETDERGIPLLLNSYVDARIRGNTVRNLIELPRNAVRNGNQVFLIEDETLAIETVEIVWRRPNSVLVDSGLRDGDRIIVGPMPQPVEGMAVRRANATSESDVDRNRNDAEPDPSGAAPRNDGASPEKRGSEEPPGADRKGERRP